MGKFWLLWLLVLATMFSCASVKAQTAPVTQEVVALQAPACWPSQVGGEGVALTAGTTTVDAVAYASWWCLVGFKYQWSYVFLMPGAVGPEVPQVTTKGVLDGLFIANVKMSCALPYPTDDPVLVLACEEIKSKARASRPADPVYRVPAGTATDRSRPTYLLVAGVLKTQSVRAQADELCECQRLSHIVGKTTYCGVRSLPNIAVCTKR